MLKLAQRPEFQLGDLRISPARRRVDGPRGSLHIEPQIMVIFLRLLDSAGVVITRLELFEECWGGAIVGDDSLNRAIAGARKIAASVGSKAFEIETIPRTGYLLRLAPSTKLSQCPPKLPGRDLALEDAVENAYDCWRTGLPSSDEQAIATLRAALASDPRNGRAWGIYALLLRKAAEYSEPDRCPEFVRQCEQAARRALALVPHQSDALVALAGIIPIFGNWSREREQLLSVLEIEPEHVPASHDLAVLEMATGRPSAARPIIEKLIADDPLAATFYYKRMYHLWTFGEIAELDQVASRALQLWPQHPAIWAARFWSLLFTERAAQALRLVEDDQCRPAMPSVALDLLGRTCKIAAGTQRGSQLDPDLRNNAVALAVQVAGRGPAQAVAALMSLCALDAVSEAFQVAYGYYLGQGRAITPLRRSADDPSITDQHRRVTQPLFIPSARVMCKDPRFLHLCRDIGLTAYWGRFGLLPDFMDAEGPGESRTPGKETGTGFSDRIPADQPSR